MSKSGTGGYLRWFRVLRCRGGGVASVGRAQQLIKEDACQKPNPLSPLKLLNLLHRACYSKEIFKMALSPWWVPGGDWE